MPTLNRIFSMVRKVREGNARRTGETQTTTRMNYQEWQSIPDKQWMTEPINCTCEVAVHYEMCDGILQHTFCGNATVKAYPAFGKGWQSLCARHAKRHPEAFDVYEMIANGETWA